jgi:hypothetical protein
MTSLTTLSQAENLVETPVVEGSDRDSLLHRKDANSDGSPQKVPKKVQGPLVSWWLESLAVVVSLLLLTAILGILYRFDGEEQPDWPYWINLNAVVATLSTILRAQLLLVAAEGQLQMLARHPQSTSLMEGC